MVKQLLPDVGSGYALDNTNFGDLAFIVPEEGINLVIDPMMDGGYGYYAYNGIFTLDKTEQKFSYMSAKVTRTINPFGLYYPIILGASSSYTFSGYVKARKMTTLWIEARVTAGWTLVSRKKYTANGDWQRLILTFPTTTAVSYSVVIVASASTTGYFYTDGWQLENKPYATTLITGSYVLNLDDPNAYYWNGQAFNSGSTRMATTSHGGKIVTLSSMGIYLSSVGGLGLRGIQNNIQILNDGTGYYDGSIRTARQIAFVLTMYGTSYDDIKKKMTLLRQCIYTNTVNAGKSKLLLLNYDEFDQQAKEIEIEGYFSGAIETNIDNIYQKKLVITYDMPLPSIVESGNYSFDLYFNQALTVNYAAKMDNLGAWTNLNNGFNGAVRDMIETPDGCIWACGAFTTANGVQCRRIAYWNGTQWIEPVGITSGDVYCLEFDGTYVWVGGSFIISGLPGGIYLAKINFQTHAVSCPKGTPTCGSDFTGGAVKTLYYDVKTNRLYIGGAFTESNSVTQANGGAGIVCLDLTANVYRNMYGITAGSTEITSVCLGVDGKIYAAGQFTGINQGSGAVITVDDISRFTWGASGTSGAWANIGSLTGPSHKGCVIKCGPDGNIYLGGTFMTIGGGALPVTGTHNIAKMVGSSWNRLSTAPLPAPGGWWGFDINISTGTAVVYDLDWDSNGVMHIVGHFNQADGAQYPEAIALYQSGSYKPSTMDTNQSPCDTFYTVCVSRRNEVYLGSANTSAATVSRTVLHSIQEETYPSITVIGPGTLSSIINRSNGRSIWFNNLDLVENEVVYMYFSPYGNYFYSTLNRDMKSFIIGGSDADFKLTIGDNVIDMFMFNGSRLVTADTAAYMMIRRIYDGIEATQDVSI